MSAFFDLQLAYDAGTRRVDLALAANGDLAIDRTALTPMLVSLGCDRRARPDDELPSGRDDLNRAVTIVARRGWAGDAIDILGRLSGSRLWLLDRAKQHEMTRRLAEIWASEALAWASSVTGQTAAVSAAWLRRGVLTLTCRVADDEIELPIGGL